MVHPRFAVPVSWLLLWSFAGSSAAGPGTRPGAGTVLIPPTMAPTTHMSEAGHDPVLNRMWIGTSNAAGGVFNVVSIDLTTGMPGPNLLLDEMDAGGGSPAGPDVDGPVDGLSVLANGNLLCTDQGGDGTRFGDTIFEIAPAGPGLANFWYTSNRLCTACRPNTNLDVPQRDLIGVAAISASGGLLMPGTDVFVARATPDRATTTLARIELLPGQPGGWRLLQDVPCPLGVAATSIAWDPDQAAQNGLANVYWFTWYNQHNFLECTWNPATMRFSVNQVVPAPLEAAGAVNRVDPFVAPIRGTAVPHRLFVGDLGYAAASSFMAVIDSGTGAPDVPAEEGFLYHSTRSNALGSPTDPMVDCREVQLWRPGTGSPISQWTTEQARTWVFPGGATILEDVDALAIDPSYTGNEPTFFEMFWSDRADQPTALWGPFLDGDVVRYRRDGTRQVLIDEATIIAVLGITAGNLNTDGLAILPNGALLLSFSDTTLPTAAGSLFGGANILDGDVVLIPPARMPMTGYWVYRESEWSIYVNNAVGAGWVPTELDGLEVDRNGVPMRPNPWRAGTTRPDVLFAVDYPAVAGTPSGWRRNHVFSTRFNGVADGTIVRDARTFGYGAWNPPPEGILLDGLALPRMAPSFGPHTVDAFVQENLAPAATQILRLIGRNLPPNDHDVLFAVNFAPLVVPIDGFAGFGYYPLMVAPLPGLLFPAAADSYGLVELRFDGIAVGIGATLYVQVASVTSWTLGTVSRVTLF
jgi:hypothetical protein